MVRAYETRHGRKPSRKRVDDITANFVQAREYFTNAARAAITVKPLLQFYGVRALTYGLILNISANKDASALKPSHGLKEVSWSDKLRDGTLDFGGLTVELQKGTFWELIEATGNKSYFTASTNRVNWQATFPIPPLGTHVSFLDVVSCMADLGEDYSVWTEEPFPRIVLESFKMSADQQRGEVGFGSHVGDEVIRRVLHYLGPDLAISEVGSKHRRNKVVSISISQLPYFSQFTDGPLGIGDVRVASPIADGIYLNALSQYYILSYILGMVVRYFPAAWISLSRQSKGDSIFPLLNRLMDVIQNKFPLIVWDFLQSPYDFELEEASHLAFQN